MQAFVAPCRYLSGSIAAPPSKNYTTRYLLAAALAEGESLVVNPAINDDALVMRDCLLALGAEIRDAGSGHDLIVRGFGGRPKPKALLSVGNAGAVLRFLMAIASLCEEVFFDTPFPDSLGRRPQGDLLRALDEMGVHTESNEGRLPIVIRGGRPRGSSVKVGGQVSSQFASALLFLAPLLPEGLEIAVTGGLRSQAAVRTTLDVLAQAGISVRADWDDLIFRVKGNQPYRAGRFMVNGDYPSALAIVAPSVLLPGQVRLAGLFPDCQGERAALGALQEMGADITIGSDFVDIKGGAPLHGIDMNGDPVIDAVLSLATAAAFAEGESVFRRVGHLRYKESDRLGDFSREMAIAGLAMMPMEENLVVRGKPGWIEGGVNVAAHHDHRLVMALTTAAMHSKRGLRIDGAEHVSKSYPGFFTDLRQLGADIELI